MKWPNIPDCELFPVLAMSAACCAEHMTEESTNLDDDNQRLLPYLCCPNIVHEYIQCHDPRTFNNDQNDILHFLSEMAASHNHPFTFCPPHGIIQSMVAVQWSKKGKVPKGIVNRNFGFMIHTMGMFPHYTEIGYHDVRNRRWRNAFLSHTEVISCSLHGTEYRVELYRKAGENMSNKEFDQVGKATQLENMTQKT